MPRPAPRTAPRVLSSLALPSLALSPLALSMLLAPLGACALSHERGGPAAVRDAGLGADAIVTADAPASLDAFAPSCTSRSDHTIEAPPARRPRHRLLLQMPRVSRDGARIAASALVFSEGAGGLGISDLLTFAFDGGTPRVHFTSEVPYVLGTDHVPEAFLAGGGFSRSPAGSEPVAHVYVESRRFDGASFSILGTDDLVEGATEHVEVALDPRDSNVPYVEVARESPVAMRVSAVEGIRVLDLHDGGASTIETTHGLEGVATFAPTPRLSPLGARVAFVAGGDRRTLHVRDVLGDELRVALDVDAGALAFLGEDRVLVLPRTGTAIEVITLPDGSVRTLELGLADGDRLFEGIDVSAGAETFVVSESQGARLHVVRCEPRLVALARGS